MTHRHLTVCTMGVLWFASLSLAAQSPAAKSAVASADEEVAAVGSGWAALTRGDAAAAAAAASSVLVRNPSSISAASLLVQASTLGSGPAAGLASYERWIGSRTAEDPYLLRVVSLGFLREVAATPSMSGAKHDALTALAADGDISVLTDLGKGASTGDPGDLQILGKLGSDTAVDQLVAALRSTRGDKTRAVDALVATGSSRAVPPLVDLLTDAVLTNRVAAADGLGKLGDASVVTKLQPLLNDTNFSVKFAAAKALTTLRDASGLSFLLDLQNSPYPMVRLSALEATSETVDARWVSAVRDLLSDPDPQVRLLAARLIAPHDPDAARAAFQTLLSDDNIAIRSEAGHSYVDSIVSDIAGLRRFLHSPDAETRVRAATHLLELTH